ncbi:MAG: N-acetyltransferase [Verrucomicrobia bacterium]|nr:N-acetyltransferase [Verrucomicrobiota bacterium]
MNSAIEIIALQRQPQDVSRFLKLAYAIYGNDPNWVAPLLADAKKIFSDANPLFEHAEMQLWVARRDGRDAGRIAGIIDRHHNEFHRERTAFFGFFESADDPSISARLFETVSSWARQKGMARLLGPMNPTTNDECGLLVDGFDTPPVFMMTYNPRYYVPLVEAAGCTKAKDLLAFAFDIANGPKERLGRFAKKFRQREPDIVITPIRKQDLAAQLAKIKTVYNQAWADNWGFVPMTDAEIDFLAGRLKSLLTEGLAFVAETPQGPSGFLLAIPDFNQAFQPLRGRFFSPGLFRAVPYFLGWKTPKYLRCVTLGVVRSCRGRGIEAAMLSEALNASLRLGFQRGEASWILEDNTAVQRVIALFGGEVYKTYRVYERAV